MTKGYWVSMHQRVADPTKHAAYRELAQMAIDEAGGKLLVAGGKMETRELGSDNRTVVIEFPSFQAAVDAYESDGYQRALSVLGDGAARDVRIVEGV